MPDHNELIGRLKISLARPGRTRSVALEKYYDQMKISELLKSEYNGEKFPGYENISLEFPALEVIFRNSRPDWKSALENIKGVYLVADQFTGKKYVGAAYGGAGIWKRWSNYMATGHGWSDELTKVIDQEGMEYARNNFRISLLEYRSAKTDDVVIIQRESYWKKALQSRALLGYNKN